ncbi:hypothetical protein, partial [Serratia fonticola]|uniref:hypothetical protein n=1 Tax=Serratia fonticola TaxID=47917 RepID=UPI000BD3B2F4
PDENILNTVRGERELSGVVDEPVLLRKVGRGWVCPYCFRTLEVSRKMKYYTERSSSSIGSLSLWERVRVRGWYHSAIPNYLRIGKRLNITDFPPGNIHEIFSSKPARLIHTYH